ncbi:MAG TPA: biopolymer transporter ExbD [Blastocatellia bacterium]|nr:biopolymer transporter ExbD [Blastocatellia bacterium]
MAIRVADGAPGLVAEINVTPMVDVMLVLLIIFMVIAPLLQPDVTVTLAKARNPEIQAGMITDKSAVIAIPQTGRYYVGRENILRVEDIVPRVSKMLSQKRTDQQLVYIKAASSVRYGEIVDIVERLRRAEPQPWDRIALIVEKNSTRTQ